MELQFEHTKQLGQGTFPLVTHLADNTMALFFQENGALYMETGLYIENDPNGIEFDSPVVMNNDFLPQELQNIRFSGGQNWMNWLSGTKQRAAMFPESPYRMKPDFFKGFMVGAYSKEADESTPDDLENTVSIEGGDLTGHGVDYWNGYIVGRLIYKQMYGGAI